MMIAYFLGCAHHFNAQTQGGPAITTLAGNGTAGYVSAQDGAPADRAQLDGPFGVAADRFGNLYIAEVAGNRIRRVDVVTGKITTVAGTGEAGYAAAEDGLPAIHARLNAPRGIAVDDAGNVYVADTGNHRVRKVDTAGLITTIAGTGVPGYSSHQDDGPAARAQLDGPRSLAIDRAGNLYIADYNNARIRKIAEATNIISTVAGTGAAGYQAAEDGGPASRAQINHPCGVAIDRAGNLFIADTYNQRIRKVAAGTAIMTTVAGAGTAGYRAADEGRAALSASLDEPSGIAIDRTGNLYIADLNNSRIRRVAAGTGTITTIAGNGIAGYMVTQEGTLATTARLNKPSGVAVDQAGNLYIADFQNSRVRKIALTPASLYLAGN